MAADRGRDQGSEDVPEAKVRAQLNRMLDSPYFSRSGVRSRVFEYVVEQALAGRKITEADIGQEIYKAKFDSLSSTVRNGIREIRRKIQEYYDEWPDDPVRISIPDKGYVARFRSVAAPKEQADSIEARMLDQLKSSDVALRLEALSFLGRRAPEDAVLMKAIVDALLDPDLRVRSRATRIVADLKPASDRAISNLILVMNTQRGASERRDAAELRAMSARALGSFGPEARVAEPDLLDRLKDSTSVAEEAAIALLNIGAPGDPRFQEAIVNLMREGSWAATSILLTMARDALAYVPALIDTLRVSAESERCPVMVQGHVLEVLVRTGEPGISALEQFLASATPQQQTSVALAWLELDPQARHSIRRLVPMSSIAPVLRENLNSRFDEAVPLPRSIFPASYPLPRGLGEPDRLFFTPDSLERLSGKAVRSAVGTLMLNLEPSETAWGVFMSALTSQSEYWAAYAAIALGNLDPFIASRAVPEIIQAFESYRQGSSMNRAICEEERSDEVSAQPVLIASLVAIADQDTIDAFRSLIGSESRHVANLARRMMARLEDRDHRPLG